MKLTVKKKVKIACDIAGTSITQLGEKMGMSRPTIFQRLKTGKFSIEEYEKMTDILGCKLIFGFRFNDDMSVDEEAGLTAKEKVIAACKKTEISMTELGKRMGMSRQNFSSRLKVGKFSIEEYEKIADILGCEFVFKFEFTDISI